jgi:uncharacterized protein HemY
MHETNPKVLPLVLEAWGIPVGRHSRASLDAVATSHGALGRDYLHKRQWKEALAEFQSALRDTPEIAEFHFGAVAAFESLNMPRQAAGACD